MLLSTTMQGWAQTTRATRSLAGFRDTLAQELTRTGFDEFIFVPRSGTRILHVATAGTDLLDSYDRQGFRKVDPVMLSARRRRRPVTWDARAYMGRAASGLERSLWDCVLTLGYRVGVSVPLHGPDGHFGHLTCISADPRTAPDPGRHLALMLIGTLAASIYDENFSGPEPEEPALSERESTCLMWTDRGKTAWEVGRILGISTRTVNFHIQNAMRKLNAAGKHQACHLARRRGLLPP